MLHATPSRGAITYAMLLGRQAPFCCDRRIGSDHSTPPKYHYPESASRKERRQMRLGYIVEHLREDGAAKCAEVALEFDIRVEAAYVDLMQLKAKGLVRIAPRSSPALWEAV